MARRTLQASTQGLKDIRKALKRKKGGQTYLAGAVGCSTNHLEFAARQPN